MLHQSICLLQQLTGLTESWFYLGFCSFSGDAWIYCISKNEWVQFEHNYSEKPRYGKQFPGNLLQKGCGISWWWLSERGCWFLLTALLFHVSQRCRLLCAPRIPVSATQGRRCQQPAKQQETRDLGFDLRIEGLILGFRV